MGLHRLRLCLRTDGFSASHEGAPDCTNSQNSSTAEFKDEADEKSWKIKQIINKTGIDVSLNEFLTWEMDIPERRRERNKA
jgi:hypothetical protein